jgi:hypothetical protein
MGVIRVAHDKRLDALLEKIEENDARNGTHLNLFCDIGKKGKPIEEIPPLLNPKYNQTKALD